MTLQYQLFCHNNLSACIVKLFKSVQVTGVTALGYHQLWRMILHDR